MVFNTIIDIILKFSIIDISDLNLKIKKKNIFRENLQSSFLVNLFLYLISFSAIIIFGNYEKIFILLILFNISSIIIRYFYLILFFENKTTLYNFNILLMSLFVIVFLFIFYYIELINKYSLISSYAFAILSIIILNIKKIIFYLKFKFSLNLIKKRITIIYFLLKKNLKYILFLFFKGAYFPILILTINQLSNFNNQIIAISGISLAISMLAGNIVYKTYFKYNLVNIKNYKKNFFNIYSLMGFLFFLFILFFGILFVKKFYFTDDNIYFNFIYTNFIILGFFYYILELKFHQIVYNEKIKIFLNPQIVKLLLLIILFFIFYLNNLGLKYFLTINLFIFATISIYTIFISKTKI